jgi:hypothetical protein
LIDKKIVGYLLSDSHPTGRYKYRYFARFGFQAATWTVLRDAFMEHAVANDVTIEEETDFGIKFIVDGSLPSPDGRNPAIRSIWIRRHEETEVRLVTTYPFTEDVR